MAFFSDDFCLCAHQFGQHDRKRGRCGALGCGCRQFRPSEALEEQRKESTATSVGKVNKQKEMSD